MFEINQVKEHLTYPIVQEILCNMLDEDIEDFIEYLISIEISITDLLIKRLHRKPSTYVKKVTPEILDELLKYDLSYEERSIYYRKCIKQNNHILLCKMYNRYPNHYSFDDITSILHDHELYNWNSLLFFFELFIYQVRFKGKDPGHFTFEFIVKKIISSVVHDPDLYKRILIILFSVPEDVTMPISKSKYSRLYIESLI
ncbi:hypothetical protein D3C87_1112320 [compost metagenome]